MLVLLSLFIIPFYSIEEPTAARVTVFSTFHVESYNIESIVNMVASSLMIVLFMIAIFKFIKSLVPFLKKQEAPVTAGKQTVLFYFFICAVFFILGFALSIFMNFKGYKTSSGAYVPMILEFIIAITHGIFCSIYEDSPALKESKKKSQTVYKILIIVFTSLFFIITLISCSLKLIIVSVETEYLSQSFSVQLFDVMIKGLSYSQGLQAIGFFGYAMLFICAIITALGLIGAFSNSREYPTVCKVAITANFITILLIALFSQFYTMAQYTNFDNILSILKVYGFEESLSYNDFNIYSETLPMAYIAAGLAATLLVVKPFTHVETPMCNTVPSGNYSTYSKIQPASTPSNPSLEIMDSCPAFSEIDRKIPEFQAIEQVRKKNTYENISLPKLVNFVVEYARESRLHLSYSAEDIATFVAGLGASKLSILQGMSGTGKTSLPKIFAEAIMGNVDIIEIESSWKDKNELLGYYNEFSKIYTPRKFTQSLYRATLNPDVITFIVLDEMNLSRIEYYFSDFLSLMENEPDKREVRLLNQAIFNNSEGMSVPYAGLTDGHTIKISPNIWFIGTANRDESTFEISDKVYDRACTMNFDKRAPKARSFMEPKQPKYISYNMFDQLIGNAVDSFDFDIERCEIIAKTENLLQPYNISFGNRIAGQIERFVKIYCSCFSNRNEVINEAIEKILLSKVVAKLEFKTIADKEKLAKQFDKLGLSMCSSFVRKLSEDTMYE